MRNRATTIRSRVARRARRSTAPRTTRSSSGCWAFRSTGSAPPDQAEGCHLPVPSRHWGGGCGVRRTLSSVHSA